MMRMRGRFMGWGQSKPRTLAKSSAGLGLRREDRQDDGEGAAFAWSRLHLQAEAHFLGNFVNHRKAQAGAAAGGKSLGGEERLKNARQDFRRDAAAGVAHGNENEPQGIGRNQHEMR